mmetsp:Transcript_8428/g.35233  ORF Transcript_8428/g.35233 Transcript_8428/m.35233 type:complete len:270 (-) Transcript_8428:444-1253(-)
MVSFASASPSASTVTLCSSHTLLRTVGSLKLSARRERSRAARRAAEVRCAHMTWATLYWSAPCAASASFRGFCFACWRRGRSEERRESARRPEGEEAGARMRESSVEVETRARESLPRNTADCTAAAAGAPPAPPPFAFSPPLSKGETDEKSAPILAPRPRTRESTALWQLSCTNCLSSATFRLLDVTCPIFRGLEYRRGEAEPLPRPSSSTSKRSSMSFENAANCASSASTTARVGPVTAFALFFVTSMLSASPSQDQMKVLMSMVTS